MQRESLRIEYLALDSLRPAKRNAKKHAGDVIEASLGSHGAFQAVAVVDARTGRMVAGHGRVEALRAMQGRGEKPPRFVRAKGKEWLVPALTGWSSRNDKEAERVTLADNQTTIAGGHDEDLLTEILRDMGDDARGIGFGDDLLDVILGETKEGETDPDEVPVGPENVTVTRGEVYALGEHRVACGDAFEERERTRLFDGAKIGALISDPPYGISIVGGKRSGVRHGVGEYPLGGKGRLRSDAQLPFGGRGRLAATVGGSKAYGSATSGRAEHGPKSRNQIIKANTYRRIAGDDRPFDPGPLVTLAPVVVLFGGNYFADKLPPSSGWLCWDKREGKTTNSFADCELAWTNQKRPARVFSHLWNGLHRASERGKRMHPTQKPVALYEWIINEYAQDDVVVADLFMGSGPCLIAAEMTGHVFRGMDLEPAYIQLAIDRWEKFTGRKARKV